MTDKPAKRGRPANKEVVAIRGIFTSKGKVCPGETSEPLPAAEADGWVKDGHARHAE